MLPAIFDQFPWTKEALGVFEMLRRAGIESKDIYFDSRAFPQLAMCVHKSDLHGLAFAIGSATTEEPVVREIWGQAATLWNAQLSNEQREEITHGCKWWSRKFDMASQLAARGLLGA